MNNGFAIMWCVDCCQDVPGVASPEDTTEVVCARCRQPLRPQGRYSPSGKPETHSNPQQQTQAAADESVDDAFSRSAGSPQRDLGTDAPWDLEDWQLSDDLQSAERLVRSHAGPRTDRTPAARWRVDGPHYPSAYYQLPAIGTDREPQLATEIDAPTSPGTGTPETIPTTRHLAWTLLMWFFLTGGTMAFTCGGVLALWSLLAERAVLWNLGVAFLLAGQTGLLMGLVLQWERLWHNHRQTRATLSVLKTQLDSLRRTTTFLTDTHRGSAQSFHTHLAEGAPPELLLADLKSQMDLLAGKLSR